MKSPLKRIHFVLGKVPFSIKNIEVEHGNLNKVPENINIIRIRLDSPTFFYNASKNELEEFNAENFLNYQCEKFKQLGIMNLKPRQLYPYIWIINKKTSESWGHLTHSSGENGVISYRGEVGNIVFKIVGSPPIRNLLGKILYLSEFTGIGTRTSMGFGHNTLLSIEPNL
jgi:CRISPR-associated endoribonuclease Cas6